MWAMKVGSSLMLQVKLQLVMLKMLMELSSSNPSHSALLPLELLNSAHEKVAEDDPSHYSVSSLQKT